MSEKQSAPESTTSLPNGNHLSHRKAIFAACSEILFILLPFIVSAIVFWNNGKAYRLITMPEWSIAASVLFGQSIVRLISAVMQTSSEEAKTNKRYKGGVELIALVLSLIIVLLLVPSLLVLSFATASEQPHTVVTVTQIVLFAISLILFFGIMVVSHIVTTPADS